ncbi:hypothetical protein BS329_15820 [Amycolatopsis coloradensis]|uniref:Uncharacterized protein n=1 Tax=Amycolatopsis coloradensis TaxID=76021 RepID=A0A1R0KUC1_9PSEU|nr:hypothetical protein [Amycolatopsis coloradensis]OLZ51729.1 hypothetical protein BS329_15820 [Amycolatopsis coloradensis]
MSITKTEMEKPVGLTQSDYASGIDPAFFPPLHLLIAATFMDRTWHEYASLRVAMHTGAEHLSGGLAKLRARGYLEYKRIGQHTHWRMTRLGEEKLAEHLDATRRIFVMAEELRAASHRISIDLNDIGKKLARDYRAGATITQIAEVRNMTYYGTRLRLLRYGVQLRQTGPAAAPASRGMVRQYRKGASITEVAEEQGLTYGTARRKLIKARAGVRPQGGRGTAQTKIVVATGYAQQRWPAAMVRPRSGRLQALVDAGPRDRSREALSEWVGEVLVAAAE